MKEGSSKVSSARVRLPSSLASSAWQRSGRVGGYRTCYAPPMVCMCVLVCNQVPVLGACSGPVRTRSLSFFLDRPLILLAAGGWQED